MTRGQQAREIAAFGLFLLAAACFYAMLMMIGYGLLARDVVMLGLGVATLACGVLLAWAGRRIDQRGPAIAENSGPRSGSVLPGRHQ